MILQRTAPDRPTEDGPAAETERLRRTDRGLAGFRLHDIRQGRVGVAAVSDADGRCASTVSEPTAPSEEMVPCSELRKQSKSLSVAVPLCSDESSCDCRQAALGRGTWPAFQQRSRHGGASKMIHGKILCEIEHHEISTFFGRLFSLLPRVEHPQPTNDGAAVHRVALSIYLRPTCANTTQTKRGHYSDQTKQVDPRQNRGLTKKKLSPLRQQYTHDVLPLHVGGHSMSSVRPR